MITNWTIQNFKAIRQALALELAPVTVLTGLNSSGKSSVLQSIRLVSQTLKNPTFDRPLIFNGYDVILGNFRSIVNSMVREEELRRRGDAIISIGFSMILEQGSTAEPSQIQGEDRDSIDSLPLYVNVKADFTDASRREMFPAQGQSSLLGGGITVRSNDSLIRLTRKQNKDSDVEIPMIKTATITFKKLSDEENDELRNTISPSSPPYFFSRTGQNFSADIEIDGREVRSKERRLALISHFLPRFVATSYKLSERMRERIASLINIMAVIDQENWARLENTMPSGPFTPSQLADIPVNSDLLEKMNQIVRQSQIIGPEFSGETLGTILRHLHFFAFGKSGPLLGVEVVTKIEEKLVDYLFSLLPSTEDQQSLEFVVSDPVIDAISEGSNRAVDFFARRIRYLGPLRLDPTEAQSFSPASEPDDVGAKGQFAAVVFQSNRTRNVTWWNPETKRVTHSSLENALNSWLSYLGVANRASVSESGPIGVSWQVRIGSSPETRPLGAVGVGVSQVLPILISGLLAPRGTLLLIEQPELHLHPRAQSKLAEFFWGLSQTGRRCLIETHSEALISGFRLLLVKADSMASEQVAIYFSELVAGESNFEKVVIGQDGLIQNWPTGFFDESQVLEDDITSSAIRKRASRK